MAARLVLGVTLTLSLLASFDAPRAAPMDRFPRLALWAWERPAHAVEGTRWACADEKTSAASRAAFQTLHRLFPKTDWALKTKYWYEQ
ncbi:MAG TPA: hypothetical protein VF921_02570 [Vicinamibacterales bacterium]